MIPNNDRYDLSDRLIHFFRDVDLESEDAPIWPEDTSFASGREENALRPQFLLRHAIRMGRLYATWSVRNERRTIHGDRPAVCFTEMPIPAFIEAGRKRRAKDQAMSAYGIVLRKEDAFKAGARPVIYALSKYVNAKGGKNDTDRLLPETAMALQEQYRYVAFNPSGKPDWVHEREWRWKLDQEPWKSKHGLPPQDSLALPGFNLDNSDFLGVGVIVGTKKEARQVIYGVLTKVDRGDIGKEHYSFVIPHETVKAWKALRDRGELEEELRQNAIDLNDYFGMSKKKREGLVAAFKKEVRSVLRKFDEEPEVGEKGNPPYKEKAKGRGGWIEEGAAGREAPLDRWVPPLEWKVGAHAKHLKNLYVYFWRWATWKVFDTGLHELTGLEVTDRAGIVCFITVAGFLNGPGFQKMRDDLRRSCNDIWIIDCSPEGHQPEVATRIFQGVQHPVCIVLASRTLKKDADVPAYVRFHSLPRGRREEKFAALASLSLDDKMWTECPNGQRDPFLPKAADAWASFAALDDLFIYNTSGVMPGRTWVIAPDAELLRERWSALLHEKDAAKKEKLFYPHKNGDKTVNKRAKNGLTGHEFRPQSVAQDKGLCITPTGYAFRSFDRQWIIPDNRLINRPNPTLWDAHSQRQVYVTAPEDRSPSAGPALTLTALIPDLHHYAGRGGRVFPLWRDAAASMSNVKPALLGYLSKAYGRPVSADEGNNILGSESVGDAHGVADRIGGTFGPCTLLTRCQYDVLTDALGKGWRLLGSELEELKQSVKDSTTK